ncbi:MAG: phosphate ABC transporter substrate-binding protein [Methylococcales bacterium]|jgi:hypothetical protein|nr:phosphate ABC transporter substrate-binding protein [Methylococcales bacterium]MBT7409498.1 phosphate ABC transporter substrate-binding protein [Methylococcales bacterium]
MKTYKNTLHGKLIRHIGFVIIYLLTSLTTLNVMAEGVIIVHSSNTTVINLVDVKKWYLGKKSTFTNGKKVKPMLPNENDNLKVSFYQKVIRKSNAQYNAYWAKRVFTGKGSPPALVSSQQIIQEVSTNTDRIGVVDASLIDGKNIRVIQTFKLDSTNDFFK